jgi:AraC family transcriptional regulator, regulatory protein of adaptative response / methylated-DNA-[protein]-cysteine methyltransferase
LSIVGILFESAEEEIMTKTSTRRKSADQSAELRYGLGKTTLGRVLVAVSDKGVVSILIGGSNVQVLDDLQSRFPKAHLIHDAAETRSFVKAVMTFVEDPSKGLAELPLDIRGTEFQKRVWKSLLDIPSGETITYTEIATKIGSPKAIRAVGNACSVNNFAFAVPCHRVLHKDGSLSGGYHWGDDRQREMIDREARVRHSGKK